MCVVDEALLKTFEGRSFDIRKLESIDGMITNIKNVPLCTYYADCVPLYFVDVKNKAVGLSHSGWRGTSMLMGLRTVDKMVKVYKTNPADLICAIGPSICMKCYEVSFDVIDSINKSFRENNIDIPDISKLYYEKDNEKFQLDLTYANRLILKAAGVKESNIYSADTCTCCNNDYLFSHRATNGKRGNLAALIEII